MEEKTADNKVIETKYERNIIEENIDISKKTLKSLDQIEDCLASLDKNLSKCIELLSVSMKGKKASGILNRVNETKTIDIKNSLSSIDEYREKEEKKIKEYKEQMDKLDKEDRKKAEKEENKK